VHEQLTYSARNKKKKKFNHAAAIYANFAQLLFFSLSITATNVHSSIQERLKNSKGKNYTRITKLCNSYGDEDS